MDYGIRSGKSLSLGMPKCNAPDTTFHIRNSDSCHFRLCDFYFLRGWVFVCCFAFCSCYASRLMSSFALHRHRFLKTCIRSSLPFLPFAFITFPRIALPALTVLYQSGFCFPLDRDDQTPLLACPKTAPNPNRAVVTVGPDHPPTSIKYLCFLNWTS